MITRKFQYGLLLLLAIIAVLGVQQVVRENPLKFDFYKYEGSQEGQYVIVNVPFEPHSEMFKADKLLAGGVYFTGKSVMDQDKEVAALEVYAEGVYVFAIVNSQREVLEVLTLDYYTEGSSVEELYDFNFVSTSQYSFSMKLKSGQKFKVVADGTAWTREEIK